MTGAAPEKSGDAQKVGRLAEDLALDYLLRQGLNLIERNFRCRQGEIDLIMRDGACCVFIEVRFRSSPRYGSALESVNSRKRSRIAMAAGLYLAAKRLDQPSRFDVVAVTPKLGSHEVEWVKDAFRVT